MRFDKFFRAVGPAVAMAAAAGLGGCQNADVRFQGKQGVPLADLDTSGPAPRSVTLLGPDNVEITRGSEFAIRVDDAPEAEDLRFVLEDGALGILRDGSGWNFGGSAATVHVTVPELQKMVLAGSGGMSADGLTGDAEVTIAGSGSARTPNVDADSLDVTIAGSGSYRAGGRAQRLDLTVAGSGDADMSDLRVDNADISIAGSGDVAFASDGEVSASIMGSGNVTVRGAARCTVRSMGSGTLTCERGDEAA